MPRKVKKPAFKVGDFVFAKLHGYRAWPARIVTIIGRFFVVYFYGTYDRARVTRHQLYLYEKSYKRFASASHLKNAIFKHAMLHIQDALTHPDEDIGYEQMLAEYAHQSESDESDIDIAVSHLTADPNVIVVNNLDGAIIGRTIY
ncbi:hepatoma-derived growth factor [Scaptodrosophila lebanonensis]|uniref:Hepatoma-derived growth factor n=1 Tax=Drosophila lebanonensis TaxID=7225 RepID=A0A6J2T312_DROLE|nr:hepatoma-derived growth factor [Scaptodrosophila lebanonensis]